MEMSKGPSIPTVKPRVLCLFTDSRLETGVLNSPTLKTGQYMVCNFLPEVEKCRRQGRLNMKELCERAVEFVQKNNIDIVIPLSDDMTLLHGVLCKKFPDKFQGPSLESSFIAMHKYYTRELIDPNPVPFCHIELDKPPTVAELKGLVSAVGLPAILKPSLGTYSAMVKKVSSFEELVEAVENARKRYDHSIHDYVPFFERYLDVEKFPLALKRSMILEKYMDVPKRAVVDGYIWEGEITHWVIGDWVYWSSEPDLLQQHLLPSVLPEATQAKIWQNYDAFARRLIDFGFDRQFLDIEVFVCDDGDVRLMEANPRMSTVFIPQYLSVMNVDPLETLLDALQGKQQSRRIEFTGKHSSTVFFPTLISGKVSDIMDLEVAKSLEHLILDVEDDEEVAVVADTGTYLGHTWLFGESREELLNKHQALYAVLFKTDPIQRGQIDG